MRFDSRSSRLAVRLLAPAILVAPLLTACFHSAGIQLLLSGDFCQLPPVVESGSNGGAVFCFQAKSWARTITNVIELDRVFRQSVRACLLACCWLTAPAPVVGVLLTGLFAAADRWCLMPDACVQDSAFVSVLSELRNGQCPPHAKVMLSACVGRKLRTDDGIVPTRLYATKASVAEENERNLRELKTEAVAFMAQDSGQEPHLGTIKKNCPVPEELQLKVGAQGETDPCFGFHPAFCVASLYLPRSLLTRCSLVVQQ